MAKAIYRPRFISQFGWGTRWDNENCVAAAGCIALDRHTLGQKAGRNNGVTPPLMRLHSDRPNAPEGLSLSNLEYAWKEGYNENLRNPLPYEPFDTFVKKVKEGCGAVIFGDCETLKRVRKCPPGFPANHALYINEIRDNRANFYDPADDTSAEGIGWVDLDTLARYSENWVQKEGGARGHCNAAYTQVTDEVDLPDMPLPAGCAGQLLSLLRF